MKHSKDFLIQVYRNLVTSRKLEERLIELYHQGRVPGQVHPGCGEEATFVGGCMAIEAEDYMMTTHRSVAANWVKGISLEKIFCDVFGKRNGTNKGKGASIRICSKQVLGMSGTQGGVFPIATGAGLSIKFLKEKKVMLAFFGDDTSNRGTFHESLNLASLWKLPVIFLCDNNQYGISVHISKSTSVPNIADRGIAYNIPSEIVDGNSVIEVYEATKRAAERARSGEGPSLIEAKTYRFEGHMMGDVCSYRTKEEEDIWREKCPVKSFENYLLSNNVIDSELINRISEEADTELESAINYAENSEEPKLEEVFDDLFV